MDNWLTEADSNTGREQSESGSLLMPHDAPIPARRKPVDEFYFQENEFTDIYSPLVGPFATSLYMTLCRKSYGKTDVKCSVRDLANATGMSPTTAARGLQSLRTVGLIRPLSTSGNQKSVYQLLDVKALAASHGAKRERRGAPFELPQTSADRLRSELNALRRNQQGKSKASALLKDKRNVEIAFRGGIHSRFFVSQRDASVSHVIRQRTARETQSGTHLLQEERRNKETPIYSLTPSNDGDAQKDKDSPDEDEPDGLLRWATAIFTGVIDDLRDYLLDTRRPPNPNLSNGAEDWNRFGFGNLAVDGAARRDGILVLMLGADDSAAVQLGLKKYTKRWEAALLKWYGCKLTWEVQRRSVPFAKKC